LKYFAEIQRFFGAPQEVMIMGASTIGTLLFAHYGTCPVDGKDENTTAGLSF